MRIEYYSGGQKRRLTANRSAGEPDVARTRLAFDAFDAGPLADLAPVFARRFHAALPPLAIRLETLRTASPAPIVATGSIAVENPTRAELTWLRKTHGFEVTQEGSHGKVLLAAPPDARDRERLAVQVALQTYERQNVTAAQPDVVETVEDPPLTQRAAHLQWALDNPGDPGVVGADVAATAAWTITAGSPDVTVAVIDDGVETDHPGLVKAVRAQRNFVERAADGAPTDTATPPSRRDDYHGTACAGIVVSRDPATIGLAHGAALAACRVATKVNGGWQLRWFDLADGIDWAADDAGASVISLSLQCAENDLVTNAIDRARTQGRRGKGCVIVAAAGNRGMRRLDYPARREGVLAVGASNQWDTRKVFDSPDGDTTWASNFGTGLGLLAPGVQIRTTDLTGAAGRDPGSVNGKFSGTSAATPFVAATAALALSVRGDLPESAVRALLQSSAEPLGAGGWNPESGSGRLNAYTAVRAARRFTP